MGRRWFKPGVVLLMAAVAVTGVVALWPGRPAVSWWQFQRIAVGMTRAEVVVALGAPPGDYTTRPHLPVTDGAGNAVWIGDEGTIFVRFDEAGRVSNMYFMETLPSSTPRAQPSLFQRVRAWLGL